MPTETVATEFLARAGVPFTTVHYDYAPQKGHIGEQAAQAIDAPSAAVFKTLATKIDRKTPVFAVVPVAQRVDFKALAASMEGRNAKMMQPDEAHDRTGFVSGGTTPFGSRQTMPVVLDESALKHDKIWINAGAQGFLACLSPQDVIKVTNATLAKIAL